MTSFLVRRSPSHAVVAHVRETVEGVTLLRVTPDTGPMPVWEDQEGLTYPDRRTLRRALLSRLRAVAIGAPPLNTLDRVLLSRESHDAWMRLARDIARQMPAAPDPDTIPDEDAQPLPDGTLRIFVPGIEGAELIVPAGQWALRTH